MKHLVRHRLLMTGLVLTTAACDSLLDVPPPPVVPPSVLDNPALAGVMVQGAIADFECAYANYIVATAFLTDELYATGTLGGPFGWDRRRNFESGGGLGCVPNNSFGVGVYTPLSTARFQADDAFRRLLAFDADSVPAPGRTTLLATAAAYAGYAYTVMGEGFCEAAFDLGPALPWREILARARERFDTALVLAESAGAQSIINLALVGRARVRLDLGDPDSAAIDAAQVQDNFVLHATYSSASERRYNRVAQSNDNQAAVDPRYQNLQVDGLADPRVPVSSGGRQLKYTSEASPIVIASWREAQLIIAEAVGGQTAVDRINALRASTSPTLPPYGSTDLDSIAQQVRVERQRELFLEGHRLNDMLRLGIPFDTVDHTGAPMGTLTCLRLPSVEIDNNPNIITPPRTTRD